MRNHRLLLSLAPSGPGAPRPRISAPPLADQLPSRVDSAGDVFRLLDPTNRGYVRATLATNDFEQFRKPTRREKFLAGMNTVLPWAELVAVIEPFYRKTSSAGGRPAIGLERMLRIHCLQLFRSVGPGGRGSAVRPAGDAGIRWH